MPLRSVVNASTAFTDGEQFGFGAEIGISTQKLHARGPMGLPELTSTKWVVWGNGQIGRRDLNDYRRHNHPRLRSVTDVAFICRAPGATGFGHRHRDLPRRPARQTSARRRPRRVSQEPSWRRQSPPPPTQNWSACSATRVSMKRALYQWNTPNRSHIQSTGARDWDDTKNRHLLR